MANKAKAESFSQAVAMDHKIETLPHHTIRQHNLTVCLLPVVHMQTRQIYGDEGLIRGPVNTVLHAPPVYSRRQAQTGRLAELDFLCCQQVIKRFAQLGLPGRLFINIDPSSLRQEHTLGDQTMACIEAAGLNPTQLIIELTETHPVENVRLMQQAMVHYRQLGFRVALDDLGAGYAGLKLWSEIRPDIVKIDRHYIQGVDLDRTKLFDFSRGDQVIRFLSSLLVANIDEQLDFIGHIGSVITALDRPGKERQYSQMTLSAGAVVVQPSPQLCHIDLSAEASIAKRQAKAMPGTCLYIHTLSDQAAGPAPPPTIPAPRRALRESLSSC